MLTMRGTAGPESDGDASDLEAEMLADLEALGSVEEEETSMSIPFAPISDDSEALEAMDAVVQLMRERAALVNEKLGHRVASWKKETEIAFDRESVLANRHKLEEKEAEDEEDGVSYSAIFQARRTQHSPIAIDAKVEHEASRIASDIELEKRVEIEDLAPELKTEVEDHSWLQSVLEVKTEDDDGGLEENILREVAPESNNLREVAPENNILMEVAPENNILREVAPENSEREDDIEDRRKEEMLLEKEREEAFMLELRAREDELAAIQREREQKLREANALVEEKARESSLLTLQCWTRGFIGRKEAKRRKSARNLQRLWRGYIGRRKAANEKKLQIRQRMEQQARELEEKERALEQRRREKLEEEKRRVEEQRKLQLEKEQERLRESQERYAMSRSERESRMYEEEVLRLKREKEEEERKRREAEILRLKREKEEEERKRREAEILRLKQQKEEEERMLRRQQRASVDIQRLVRGHLGRRRLWELRQLKAATDIQRVQRGWMARRSVQDMFRPVVFTRGTKRKGTRAGFAAVEFQKIWRGYRARTNPENPLVQIARAVHNGAIGIQRLWRGYRDRIRARTLRVTRSQVPGEIDIDAFLGIGERTWERQVGLDARAEARLPVAEEFLGQRRFGSTTSTTTTKPFSDRPPKPNTTNIFSGQTPKPTSTNIFSDQPPKPTTTNIFSGQPPKPTSTKASSEVPRPGHAMERLQTPMSIPEVEDDASTPRQAIETPRTMQQVSTPGQWERGSADKWEVESYRSNTTRGSELAAPKFESAYDRARRIAADRETTTTKPSPPKPPVVSHRSQVASDRSTHQRSGYGSGRRRKAKAPPAWLQMNPDLPSSSPKPPSSSSSSAYHDAPKLPKLPLRASSPMQAPTSHPVLSARRSHPHHTNRQAPTLPRVATMPPKQKKTHSTPSSTSQAFQPAPPPPMGLMEALAAPHARRRQTHKKQNRLQPLMPPP